MRCSKCFGVFGISFTKTDMVKDLGTRSDVLNNGGYLSLVMFFRGRFICEVSLFVYF